jgi:cellulose biosynthesis protein BcsQ
LTEASIRLADMVIVPTIPDFLSTYGLESFCSNLWTGELARQSPLRKPKRKPYVLVTRRRPISEHARTVRWLREETAAGKPNFFVLKTEIRERAAIAEALGRIHAYPSFSQKWRDDAETMLGDLVREVKEILHGA